MNHNTSFSINTPTFHGRNLPESGYIVGYPAIIEHYRLETPIPEVIALINIKHKTYQTEAWMVFTPRYQPEESCYHHLVFALKYEGINLLVLKKLFEKLSEREILELLSIEVTGQYSRRIWFLYEWLMEKKLPIPDLTIKNYVTLLDDKLQFTLSKGEKSPRHRIVNNLPGTINFCPLVRKTKKIKEYASQDFVRLNDQYLKGIRKSILQRAAAFLLLKDSKASFTIEGESPKSKRAARWSQAIGQAGVKDLSHEELCRLQQLVIENTRFIEMGYRKKGGFVGERDKDTFSPLPDHISAKHQDIESLMTGLMESNRLLLLDDTDPIMAAAVIAFGFVFIHPFVDGNGRIHRYLIHHVLAKKQFSKQGLIFPISAAILDSISDYRSVLESYSIPLLDLIEWKETKDHNLEVLNETIDYYRYFDATRQVEFLYKCVKDTIENILPEEVDYLTKFEEFKNFVDETFEMPDDMVALLLRFLEQNNGKLSSRAKIKEFKDLSSNEVLEIEKEYSLIFGN